jgi:hypothetical protein
MGRSTVTNPSSSPTISGRDKSARVRSPLGAARRARTRIDWVAVGALALLAVFLKPALHAAFRADDTWYSVLRGQLELRGDTLPSHLWTTAEHYLTESGRPNVLGTTEGLFVTWLFETPLGYHAALIVLTLGAAGALYVFVRELGLSRMGALLVITLLAGAIQFRSYHDPMLGYAGSIQIVLILTLMSLLLFVRGLRRDDRRLLVLSLLVFLPCPLIYEGTYTLVAVHGGIALLERRGLAALRACLPFLALGGFFVVVSYVARRSAPSVVPGYEVGGSALEALRTYFIQLFAPLPGSNVVFKADFGAFLPIGGNPTKPELLAGLWRGAVVFTVLLAVGLAMAGRDGSKLPSARTLWSLAVVGGLLWVSSVVIISFAPKYQTELVVGKGHLPTLIQVFGWGLVATAVFLALLRLAVRRSAVAVKVVAVGAAGVLGFGAGVVGFNNLRVIGLEAPIRETRSLLELAAGEGVFDAMPRESTLIFSTRDLGWHTGSWAQVPDALEAMLMGEADRRLDGRIVPPPEAFDCPRSGTFPPPDCEPLDESAAWVRVRARPGGGTVLLAHLPPSSSEEAFEATTDDLRVFAQDEESESVRPPRLIGTTARGRPWSSDGVNWRRVEAGGDWAIFETDVTKGPLPVAATLDSSDGVFDFTALGTPDRIVRIYGTKQLLP